jgi:Protein of unknown function (DUF4054)
MNLERFLARFPEFDERGIKSSLIAMAIAEAQNEMNRTYWGEMFEAASHLLAAHKLAISPMGEPCRLEATSEKTIYQLEYERLCKAVFLGAHVV